MHNKLRYIKNLTFCAGVVRLKHLGFLQVTFSDGYFSNFFSFIVFIVYQGQLLQKVFRTEGYAHKK
jgi:hypothetical protein